MTITSELIYDVELDAEERDILKKAEETLSGIAKYMKDNDCDTLECSYPESPEYVTSNDIEVVVRMLDVLIEVRQMFA